MKIYLLCTFLILGLISGAQNGLDFDGSNDYVQTTFPGVLGSANRTFEAWIYVGSGLSSTGCIVDYGTNAVGSRNTFSVGSNYQLIFVSGGTNANMGSTNNAVAPNQWTHVAFVLNNGTGYIYANGVQVGTGNLTTVNTPTGYTNLRIGQRVSGASIPFDGIIDEVRIWNTARTQTEIMASMNNEYCALPSDLVAYYKFNQGIAGGSNGSVTSLTDALGNNNGTLTNFALTGSSSNWVVGKSLNSGSTTPGNAAITVCDSYTASNGTVWTTNGNYVDTISSATGCDSILNIALTVLQSSTGQLTANGCDSYTSPSGNNTWTTSGTYYDTLTNNIGCDSVLTINLTITSIDDYVVQNGAYLTANMTGANYQWLDCNNGFAAIAGATSRTYQATANGSYAVEISQNGCSDTSACYTVTGIGLEEWANAVIRVYPNPASTYITIDFSNTANSAQVKLVDLSGRLVASKGIEKGAKNATLEVSHLSAGFYMLQVEQEGATQTFKIEVK